MSATTELRPNAGPGLFNDCWNKIGVWGCGECPELEKVIHCRNCPVYSNAAARMLDAPAPREYLQEWAGYIAVPHSESKDERASALLFRIGPEWLGMTASWFQEVADLRPVHSLPHQRGKLVLGLVNIRGEFLVCVSLSEALGLESPAGTGGVAPHASPGRLLVVGRGAARLVFPVDEVHGTHQYRLRRLMEAPPTAARTSSCHMLGVLPWKDHSVGMLDPQSLLDLINHSLA